MRTAWKIIRNVTKYISFLIFLGFTFLLPLFLILVSSIRCEPPRPPQFEENLNKGLKYYKGLGVQQDHKEAIKWFKLALVEEEYSRESAKDAFMGDGSCLVSPSDAEMGQRQRLGHDGLVQISENALGEIYEQGKVVHQNYEEAVKWYRRALSKTYIPHAAIQDCGETMRYPKAYYNLGLMYDEGLGLPEDNFAAFFFLQSAHDGWTRLADSRSSGFAGETAGETYGGQWFSYLNIAGHSMEDAKYRMDLIAKELESYPGEMNANVELYLTDSSYFQRMLAEDKK